MSVPPPNPDSDTGEFTPVGVEPSDAANPPERLFALGTSIQRRYQFVELIAAGGMGRVYRARDLHLGREVAVKVLRYPAAASPALTETFARESRILARLRHRNVVSVYDSGQENGVPYLVMELAKGGSLARQKGSVRTSAARVVELVQKVARAVQHIHDHGMLHLNLKLGNILVDAGGEPLLCDTGAARWEDEDDTTRLMVGVPRNMAPEMMTDGVRAATPVTDVWALGVILYELLTGAHPFATGEGYQEVFRRIRTGTPPPFRSHGELTPGTDQALEAVVTKCLEKDPAMRYPSAAALADDLDRWRQGGPTVARPRHPLLGRISGLFGWFRTPKRAAVPPRVAELDHPTGEDGTDPTPAYTVTAHPSPPRPDSPKGPQAVPAAKYSLEPPTFEEAHTEWLRYHATPVEVIDPDLSHAGQFVAFFDGKPWGYDPDPTALREWVLASLRVHPSWVLIEYLG